MSLFLVSESYWGCRMMVRTAATTPPLPVRSWRSATTCSVDGPPVMQCAAVKTQPGAT